MNRIKDFNILYVEDDNLTRKSLTKFLNLTFENVFPAYNGESALEIYDEQKNISPINLIITDINMPVLSGLELVSILRERNDFTPVIFVTARNASKELLKAIELNVSHYLIKPIDVNKLVTKSIELCNFHFLNEKIKKQELEIRNYVKLIDDKIISAKISLEGKIRDVSRAFCKITHYQLNDLIEKTYCNFLEDDSQTLHKEIFKKCIKGESWEGELSIKSKDGLIIYLETKISPTLDFKDNVTGFTLICQDITDKKLIEELSITDALTGIYNRRHFNEFFPKVIKSSKRENQLVSFMLLDIDFFKQYNDTYGHQMGDNVLIKVARTIKDSLRRANDFCFRLGGEEFGILFQSDAKEKSILFANQIKENIENLKIEHCENEVSSYITISVGLVCEYGSEIGFKDIFYKNTDDLLYKAKKNGRNRVEHN